MTAVDNAKDAFFKQFHRLYKDSEFAAERQFERLTLMQKTAVARVANIEFRKHFRDYDIDERRKIGDAIRQLKVIANLFVLPVAVNDFLKIDNEVIYEDSNIKSE